MSPPFVNPLFSMRTSGVSFSCQSNYHLPSYVKLWCVDNELKYAGSRSLVPFHIWSTPKRDCFFTGPCESGIDGNEKVPAGGREWTPIPMPLPVCFFRWLKRMVYYWLTEIGPIGLLVYLYPKKSRVALFHRQPGRLENGASMNEIKRKWPYASPLGPIPLK